MLKSSVTAKEKFTINGGRLSNIRYAYGTVIISNDKKVLQGLLTSLKEESEKEV